MSKTNPDRKFFACNLAELPKTHRMTYKRFKTDFSGQSYDRSNPKSQSLTFQTFDHNFFLGTGIENQKKAF
ncbi:unnamed protein product [Meloidogyne enterolobii]|uniref:Uncharacterized protein n=1 Tax=Meloidogyne enterolobii TaxID=390850 RepID=A0ACB0XNV3_MELEN